MTPALRKLALTLHVVSSVGWLGAVLAYLAIAIAGLASTEVELVRGSYPVLALLVSFVIVPCAIAALATGLFQSLATEWGVLRHYWILGKLALTAIGTTILLLHAPRVAEVAAIAADLVPGDHRAERTALVVHAAGGLAILLAATVLSVMKPWGKTAHGKGDPAARKRYAVIAVGLVLVFVVALHLTGHAPRPH